jgi:hypothetical protein
MCIQLAHQSAPAEEPIPAEEPMPAEEPIYGVGGLPPGARRQATNKQQRLTLGGRALR